jgi:predicted MFS family arabinose efflux permease
VAKELMSAPPYSIGVFIAPLESTFGWSRAAISSGIMFNAVAAVILGPFAGLAVDRLGPRRIALVGSAAVCTAFAVLSTVGPSIWSWWAIWAGMALAAVLIKPMVWTSAVSSLFTESRGLALAATLCGTAIASTVTPVLCTYLIRDFGWRVAYLGMAGFYAVLVIPALLLFFTSAIDRRRTAAARGAEPEPVQITGVSVREGLTSFRFIRLVIAASTMVLVAANTMINFVPIMMSFGHAQVTAAGVTSLAGISTVIGRLAGGYLLDRINGNIIAGVSVAMPIASCLLLLAFPGSIAAAGGAALILGLSLGAELDAVAYLTTRHFGMRSFGVLFGTVGGALGLATGLGPLIVSRIYDVTKSYEPALWGFIPICLLGAGLFWTLGKYPDFGEAEVGSGQASARLTSVMAAPSAAN